MTTSVDPRHEHATLLTVGGSVDAGADPTFVAGNLALDLLNTARPGSSGPGDALDSASGLIAWLVAGGILTLSEGGRLLRDPPSARELLDEARALRSTLRALTQAFVDGTAPSERNVFALNRVLRRAPATDELTWGPDGPFLERRPEPRGAAGILAPVVRAAADLLREADPARVRSCRSETCGLWFLDTSRGGRRRWCSMATCGNRAKAARHYRRTRNA